jgi:hypothetical protein
MSSRRYDWDSAPWRGTRREMIALDEALDQNARLHAYDWSDDGDHHPEGIASLIPAAGPAFHRGLIVGAVIEAVLIVIVLGGLWWLW